MKTKSLLAIVVFTLVNICLYGQIEYEGTYDKGIQAFQLDNGDIKYAKYHKADKSVTVYNIDHSELATILLPIPARHSFDELKSITVNTFNADNQIELAYTCVKYSYNNDIEVSTHNVDAHYSMFVISENGEMVFEVENSNKMKIVDSEGTRRLMVYKQIGHGTNKKEKIDVYALPDYKTGNKLKQGEESRYYTSDYTWGI